MFTGVMVRSVKEDSMGKLLDLCLLAYHAYDLLFSSLEPVVKFNEIILHGVISDPGFVKH